MLSLGNIQTMRVHRFNEGGSGPIGMLVLEQDPELLEPLQLCNGDMIMQYNGDALKSVASSPFVAEQAAYTKLQVLRAGSVIDLVIY